MDLRNRRFHWLLWELLIGDQVLLELVANTLLSYTSNIYLPLLLLVVRATADLESYCSNRRS